MAKGLALDLGLNIDYVALAGSVKLATEEIELRRQIYWALYCNDKLAGWAVYALCLSVTILLDSALSTC
jgi:hypothetical protein